MTTYINDKGTPNLAPGEFAFVAKAEGQPPYLIAFGCPCGRTDDLHRYNVYLHISTDAAKQAEAGSPVWHWDGNLESPTLSPSIARHGGCEWHGYLRAGHFEEC